MVLRNNEVRGLEKFMGNTYLYLYQANYRAKVFLERNINQAIAYNKELSCKIARAKGGQAHAEVANVGSQQPTRTRARTMSEIANRLRKDNWKLNGRSEPVLKFDVLRLRGRPDSGRQEDPEDSIRLSMPRPARPKIIRARCELTIFYRGSAPHLQPRIKDRNQLLRLTELCTITMDPDDESLATIQLDDSFFIKASKLCVLTFRGPVKGFYLADDYYSQISFQPVDTDIIWPPPLISDLEEFIHAASTSAGEQADPYSINLVATFTNLVQIPPKRGEWNKMRAVTGSSRASHLNGRFEVEFDSGWSHQLTAVPFKNESDTIVRADRLPTPTSENEISASKLLPIVHYHFRKSVDDAPQESTQGINGHLSQYRKFQVRGFVCPWCDSRQSMESKRRSFDNLERLHFHLVLCHALFDFKVKRRATSPRLNEAYADIWVEVSKAYSGVTNDKTKDPREMTWIRPTRPFVLEELLNGNWKWLNEKATPYQPQVPKVKPMFVFKKRHFDPSEVKPLEARIRKKYRTPGALHKDAHKGPIFVRGKSKRFCYEGEELSESDDDVDEEWLQMRHKETIDDFIDVGLCEQQFMKVWDDHLFRERPMAYGHIPATLVRFAQQHREWLRTSSMFVEFYKHMLNLVVYGMIDMEIVKYCAKLVKGEEEWSSAGKVDVGLGLSGPLLLDSPEAESAPLPIRTKGKEKAKDDNNDDDEEHDPNDDNIQSDGNDSDVDMTDAPKVAAPVSAAPRKTGCTCGASWKKRLVVYCADPHCFQRWYHRQCVDLDRRPDSNWICQNCSTRPE